MPARRLRRWKALAAKPDELRAVPGTHMEKGRTESCKLSSDFHTREMAQTTANTHTHTKRNTEAREVAQRFKALVALAEDHGSKPSTHIHGGSQAPVTAVPEGQTSALCGYLQAYGAQAYIQAH